MHKEKNQRLSYGTSGKVSTCFKWRSFVNYYLLFMRCEEDSTLTGGVKTQFKLFVVSIFVFILLNVFQQLLVLILLLH